MATAKDEASPQEGFADEVTTRVQDAGSVAQEKASENGPHRAKHKRSSAQSLRFGFGRFIC